MVEGTNVSATYEVQPEKADSVVLNRRCYRLTRSVLLRGLGLVYLSAFSSLAMQLDGLIGARGILPAAEYLDRVGQAIGTGPATYWRVPTVFWLDASDRALHGVCWSGVGLSLLLIAGILPGPCLTLLWLFYLSLTVVGQVFLGYQWESLLLESGLLALLLTPWGFRLDRIRDPDVRFSIWLFRWLVFRLMFQSGVVKLTSGDPTWWNGSALNYHYYTQPLPTWTTWYIHLMPDWFQAAFNRIHVLCRARRPVLCLRAEDPPAHRVRQHRAVATPDRGDRQLRVLQPPLDRSLLLPLRRPGLVLAGRWLETDCGKNGGALPTGAATPRAS